MAGPGRSERFHIEVDRKVRIRISDGSLVDGRACDISGRGIGIKCKYPADLDREFELLFCLSVGGVSKPLRLKARVVFCNLIAAENLFRLGMRFTHFFGDSEEIVKAYVQQRVTVGGTGFITV